MNSRVEIFIKLNPQWEQEFNYLRNILLKNNLQETLKWGKPTYQINGKNLIILHSFKDYIAILFLEGSSLNDPNSLLTQQTPNTILPRQYRFQNLNEMKKQIPIIQDFIEQTVRSAMQNKSKIQAKVSSDEKSLQLTNAIEQELDVIPGLLAAFLALTPGKQRGYLLFFNSATKPETLTKRVDKVAERILANKGIR